MAGTELPGKYGVRRCRTDQVLAESWDSEEEEKERGHKEKRQWVSLKQVKEPRRESVKWKHQKICQNEA